MKSSRFRHLPPDKQRDRWFFERYLHGQVDKVEQNLKVFQDPNTPGEPQRETALLAVEKGHVDVVHLLLQTGANRDAALIVVTTVARRFCNLQPWQVTWSGSSSA